MKFTNRFKNGLTLGVSVLLAGHLTSALAVPAKKLSQPKVTPHAQPYHSDVPAAAARVRRDLKFLAAQKGPKQPVRHWFYDFRESQKYCLTDQEALKRNLLKQDALKPCVR